MRSSLFGTSNWKLILMIQISFKSQIFLNTFFEWNFYFLLWFRNVVVHIASKWLRMKGWSSGDAKIRPWKPSQAQFRKLRPYPSFLSASVVEVFNFRHKSNEFSPWTKLKCASHGAFYDFCIKRVEREYIKLNFKKPGLFLRFLRVSWWNQDCPFAKEKLALIQMPLKNLMRNWKFNHKVSFSLCISKTS